MSTLPTGTVTFVFTDIEGSTRLLQQLGDAYADVTRDHRRIVRETFSANGGSEVDTQGDAFFYSFGRARDAVRAAVAAQRALEAHQWPEGASVRVRMGLHTGEAKLKDIQHERLLQLSLDADQHLSPPLKTEVEESTEDLLGERIQAHVE